MVINNFELNQQNYSSSASRNITYFPSENLIFYNYKKLNLKKKNNAGRSKNGKIIFRTKTSLLIKKKNFKINYFLNYRHLGTIASFSFIPFKNKLISLVFFCNGMISYFLTTEKFTIFSFFYSKNANMFFKNNIPNTHKTLRKIKKLSFVSCLEVTSGVGAQYVRSSGTKGRLMFFDTITYSCLIKLPSGFKKIFPYSSSALLGNISIIDHKNRLNGKAGFWRKFGRKPIVRGVAMNAVDHPHGGRTKSIKTPLTPWGKITKYK